MREKEEGGEKIGKVETEKKKIFFTEFKRDNTNKKVHLFQENNSDTF